ncbi:MAG: hypothetical protein ACREC5_05990 [Thermoplasmata archaeon]
MNRTEPAGRSGLVLLGVVRGLIREAALVDGALDELRPRIVAVALSAEEIAALEEHFVGRATEPFVPLLGTETVEIRELGRFGEVRVPHPGLLAALEWSRRHVVEVRAVDPGEEAYAELFAANVGYLELVGRTLRERRLLRSPPRTAGPEEFVVAWDRQLNRGRGSRALVREREAHVAGELTELLRGEGPVACVVDRERVEPLLRALRDGSGRGRDVP